MYKKGRKDAIFFFFFSFFFETNLQEGWKAIIHVSLKSPQFAKYVILITIVWISEHSTVIANKKLGALPDAQSRSLFLILFGQSKKGGCGPPGRCARGQETIWLFLPNILADVLSRSYYKSNVLSWCCIWHCVLTYCITIVMCSVEQMLYIINSIHVICCYNGSAVFHHFVF